MGLLCTSTNFQHAIKHHKFFGLINLHGNPQMMTLTLPRHTVLPPSFVVPSSLICDLPLCLLKCMQVKITKRNPAARSRTHCTSLSQSKLP